MIKNKVVLVPFPYDDLSAVKLRPALCLTDYIGSHRHVVLAYITSQVSSIPLATDVVLDNNHPEFGDLGLRAASTVQLHRLVTVRSTFMRRELGVLPASFEVEVAAKLRGLFELS